MSHNRLLDAQVPVLRSCWLLANPALQRTHYAVGLDVCSCHFINAKRIV